MITTVTTTTTTTTTTANGDQFTTIAGIVAVMLLIAFLIAKELLSATRNEDMISVSESGFASKARVLVDKSNIVIFSMLFVFGAIVLTKIVETL